MPPVPFNPPIKQEEDPTPKKLVGKKREHTTPEPEEPQSKRQKLEEAQDEDSDGLFKEEAVPNSNKKKDKEDGNVSDGS